MIQHEINENFNVVNRYLHSRRYVYLKTFLKNEYAGGNLKVLDIGVGYGRVFSELNACMDIDYTGVELLDEFYQAANERWGNYPNFRMHLGSILDEKLQGKLEEFYDVIIGLETFEHIRIQFLPAVFEFIKKKSGCDYFITSVPVEIGLPVLIQNFGSYLVNYFRFYEYTSGETLRAFLKQTWKLKPHSGITEYPGHKGFDWRVYSYLLHQDFEIRKIYHLPLRCLPAYLSTNILFVAVSRS